MFKRGEVYDLKLPDGKGNEQGGRRPVVILSNDKSNDNSTILQYAPLTSVIKRQDLPVHIVINNRVLSKTSMVLCEHIDRMSQDEFNALVVSKRGKLSEEDMEKISYGVAAQLGFTFLLFKNKNKQIMQQ